MREPLADVAAAALRRGRPSDTHPGPHAGSPRVADVWIDGDLGFVLLLHRRDDGLVAEELYCSLRGADGVWERPDHLGGGVLGVEIADPSAVGDALAGAPVSVVAASESLVHTRGDEGELVHVWELLVSSEADAIEIERFSPASPGAPALAGRDVTGPVMLLVLLPGERARVCALRRDTASLARLGHPLELHHPEQ
jgi:hypothetical protein